MGDRSEFDQHRREYPLCSRHGRSAGEALAKFTLRVDPRKRAQASLRPTDVILEVPAVVKKQWR